MYAVAIIEVVKTKREDIASTSEAQRQNHHEEKGLD
jgi:hypothetical protein